MCQHAMPACQPPRHPRSGGAQVRTGGACSRSATGCWQAVAAAGNKGRSHARSRTHAAGHAACCSSKATSTCMGDARHEHGHSRRLLRTSEVRRVHTLALAMRS